MRPWGDEQEYGHLFEVAQAKLLNNWTHLWEETANQQTRRAIDLARKRG
jgi:hypothetical protein